MSKKSSIFALSFKNNTIMKSILLFILGIILGILCFNYALATIGAIIALNIWGIVWNGMIAYVLYVLACKCF